MANQEKLQNCIACVEIYADTLSQYLDELRSAHKALKGDPNKLCQSLDLYMDGIRYNTKKLDEYYKKTCDMIGYYPEHE
jgi:hypothetical protein